MIFIGEKLITKLWDTLVVQGIGSLASPSKIKREGKARIAVRREEQLVMAQTEIDVGKINDGTAEYRLKNNALSGILINNDRSPETIESLKKHDESTELKNFANMVNIKQQLRSIQQELNINRAILRTEEILQNDNGRFSDKKPDQDWLYKWQDYVKDISNEEIRDWWASILAGEVKNTGTISLRTLDFIKNLSTEEANTISVIGQFLMGKFVFKVDCLDKIGLNFNTLFELEELNILKGNDSPHTLRSSFDSSSKDKFYRVMAINNYALVVEDKDPKKIIKLECYVLSKIGAELLKLRNYESNKIYINEIGKKIKEQGFTVYIGDWVYINKETSEGRISNQATI